MPLSPYGQKDDHDSSQAAGSFKNYLKPKPDHKTNCYKHKAFIKIPSLLDPEVSIKGILLSNNNLRTKTITRTFNFVTLSITVLFKLEKWVPVFLSLKLSEP